VPPTFAWQTVTVSLFTVHRSLVCTHLSTYILLKWQRWSGRGIELSTVRIHIQCCNVLRLNDSEEQNRIENSELSTTSSMWLPYERLTIMLCLLSQCQDHPLRAYSNATSPTASSSARHSKLTSCLRVCTIWVIVYLLLSRDSG
jgi:hypothetical protein